MEIELDWFFLKIKREKEKMLIKEDTHSFRKEILCLSAQSSGQNQVVIKSIQIFKLDKQEVP